jgi:AcrR family transcriptional regulator
MRGDDSAAVSDVRRQVLDASAAIVAEQGVRALSFREVARRAGVSHQAPYHHFGNHHGILEALAREGFGRLTEAMQRAADKAGPDPLRKCTAAGIAYILFARDNVGHFRVMFQRSLVDLRSDEALAEAGETYATLVRLATAAKHAGHAEGLSIDDLALMCWSTAHGFATLLVEGLVDRKYPDQRGRTEALARRVVGGLHRLLANGSDS